MTRDEAAALLGVPLDADSDAVRHAWRVWARLAHPDTGGDAQHFARLDEARRVLLTPAPPHVQPSSVREPDAWTAPPRAELRGMLRTPARPVTLAALAMAALLLATLPALLDPAVGLALAAVPAALAAAIWAASATRAILDPVADPGHRMAVLALTWLPVCALQLVVSALAGAGLITVLPLLALPLVIAVAAVNPGAGLWRPIGTGGSVPVR